MKKNMHHYFEAVEDGSLNKRNIESLIIYKAAIDDLAKTMNRSALEKTNLFQMYEYLLNETQDFLIEV